MASVLDQTHLGRESAVGDPAAGVTGGDFLHHTVDLLQGEVFGFGDKEVCEKNGDDAEGSPHEEDLGGEVCVFFADEVRSNDCNDLGLLVGVCIKE
jgi:hypothetical protein